MVNQTVYPYGTGGSLPSSIGIINDLKTGGANKALAAEQGKVIGEILFSEETYASDDLTPISAYNDKQFQAGSDQVGKSLSSVSTYTGSGSRNYRIPVKGAYSVTYRKFSSSYNYGCLFLDASDVVVQGVVSTSSDPNMRTVGVPEGAVWFIWSFMPSSVSDENERVCTVSFLNEEATQTEIEDLKASVSSINEEIGKSLITESSFSGLVQVRNGYQLKADSSQIGRDIDEVGAYAATNCVNVKIPVENCAKIVFRSYNSSYEYGHLFLDENDVVIGVFANDTGTYGPFSVDVPAGAKFFVYSYITTSSFDKTITLYAKDGILSKLEEVSSIEPSALVSGKTPRLTIGRYNSNGANVGGNYLTTETIFGDFYIHLADGWKLYEAHLYDRDGKMVSYRYYNPNTPTPINRWNTSFELRDYGNANTVPEYGLRLVVCKADSSAIASGDNPIEYFVTMATSGLHRWVPEDLPNYGRALRRLDYIEHLRWIPLAKVSDSYVATTDDYYFNAGNVAVGVSYSDVAGTRKYVPNNVSLRTFMTATKNRRSLLYTEDLASNISKYGMTYTTGNRKCYYGSVCSGLTAWVMGLDTLYLSGEYGSDSIPGMSSVSSPNANNVKPLDLVWCEGHITIISDIYKDDFGAVAFVVLAEMSSPYPHRTIYTPEQFEARLLRNGGYTVHRWSGWENLTEPEASEYTQYLLGQTRKEPEWGGDIMCFAGDYAAFAEGDTIHLNARRNSVYTGVELYKNDVLLQTIDITGLSADTIVTPNTEDWVDVNLTTLNLTYGKYKARLTDGANTTDYTYFEIIGITMSATKSGSNVIVNFNSVNGTPVSIEQVKNNGFCNAPGKYHPVTAEEVSAGTVTLPWGYHSTYKYLLMLVKGDYGTVLKQITQPSA